MFTIHVCLRNIGAQFLYVSKYAWILLMDKEENPIIIKGLLKNINSGSDFNTVIEYMLVLLKPEI